MVLACVRFGSDVFPPGSKANRSVNDDGCRCSIACRSMRDALVIPFDSEAVTVMSLRILERDVSFKTSNVSVERLMFIFLVRYPTKEAAILAWPFGMPCIVHFAFEFVIVWNDCPLDAVIVIVAKGRGSPVVASAIVPLTVLVRIAPKDDNEAIKKNIVVMNDFILSSIPYRNRSAKVGVLLVS